jgi:hypothetical protein
MCDAEYSRRSTGRAGTEVPVRKVVATVRQPAGSHGPMPRASSPLGRECGRGRGGGDATTSGGVTMNVHDRVPRSRFVASTRAHSLRGRHPQWRAMDRRRDRPASTARRASDARIRASLRVNALDHVQNEALGAAFPVTRDRMPPSDPAMRHCVRHFEHADSRLGALCALAAREPARFGIRCRKARRARRPNSGGTSPRRPRSPGPGVGRLTGRPARP